MFDIIIPTYKTPIHLLKKCLASVASQTFTDFNVWICDGTPNDWKRYDDMLEVFSEHPDFTVQGQTGTGVSQARNQIIKAGSAPYVAFLDSDDEWASDYLEQMHKAVTLEGQRPDNGIWFCEILERMNDFLSYDLNTIGINEEIGMHIEREKRLQCYEIVNFIPHQYLLHFHLSSPLWFSGSVFLREALESTDLFDESMTIGEDTMLLLDVISEGWATTYLPYEGVYRNTHSSQLTKTVEFEEDAIHQSFFKKFPNLRNQVLESKTLNAHQIDTLFAYHIGGRARGITSRNCKTVYNIIDKETYDLETL